MEANYPYAITNQRGGILRSKAPSRGLWMPKLVLYGVRLLAKQFLGTVLDIEVDQPVSVVRQGKVRRSSRKTNISRHQ